MSEVGLNQANQLIVVVLLEGLSEILEGTYVKLQWQVFLAVDSRIQVEHVPLHECCLEIPGEYYLRNFL